MTTLLSLLQIQDCCEMQDLTLLSLSQVEYILRGSRAASDGKACNLKSSDNDLKSKSKEPSRSSCICPGRVWHRRHIRDIQLILDGKTGNIPTVPSLIELSMLKQNSIDNYLHTTTFLETQVNCFFLRSYKKLSYLQNYQDNIIMNTFCLED